MFKTVEVTGEPAVVALGGGSERGVPLDVCGLPGEPKGGEFLHNV